jgi:hypothetical protein
MKPLITFLKKEFSKENLSATLFMLIGLPLFAIFIWAMATFVKSFAVTGLEYFLILLVIFLVILLWGRLDD